MKKDVHIYIDYDLNKKVESNARENGRTISDEYSRLVKYSLEFEKIFEKLNLYATMPSKYDLGLVVIKEELNGYKTIRKI